MQDHTTEGIEVKRTLMAALAAPLLVAACSTGSTAPAPTVTVTETEERSAPAPVDEPDTSSDIVGDDATYLAFLASKGVVADPDTTIEVGRSVCGALDNGLDPQTLVTVAMSSGFTMDQGAAIVAAAIVTYCPWNESKVG